MARKKIYRDYRPGHEGEFTDQATFNRSQGQGKECNVHGEYVDAPDDNTITNIDQLFNLYDEYGDGPDLDEYEFHGTGDTGRRK